MKIAAIICEYNPLHNGHKHQIDETRKITGCDAVLCIMSGNFTQRAEPTIIDKYSRAESAIFEGADIVVNIPTLYSINNAEIFAQAAIKIASSFKDVQYLSFGMENNNLNILNEVADFFLEENKTYKKNLRLNLRLGDSFNDSRINAIKKMLLNSSIKTSCSESFIKTVSMPNNILAIEYIKVLKAVKSTIKPVAIKRLGSNYNDDKIEGYFSSATAIREHIYKTDNVDLSLYLPTHSNKITTDFIKQNGKIDTNLLLYHQQINFITMPINELKNIYNVREGIENRIKKIIKDTYSPIKLKEKVSTKRFKDSRINSIFLNSLLRIDSKSVRKIYKLKKLPYIKVLAINKNSNIINNLHSKSVLVIRKNDYYKIKQNKHTKKMMEIENTSNTLYNHLFKKKIVPSNDIFSLTKFVYRK